MRWGKGGCCKGEEGGGFGGVRIGKVGERGGDGMEWTFFSYFSSWLRAGIYDLGNACGV